MTGRILAVGFAVVVLLGAGYAAWTLRNDRYIRDTKDAMLRENLTVMRGAIRRFRDDNGRYPRSLEELVPKYLARVPIDPVTGTSNWRLDTEETVVPTNDFGAAPAEQDSTSIVDVHSAAGKPYSDY